MNQTDEQKLIEQVMAGDRTALGQLLEYYQDRLYNVVLRMVTNRDDALEITQDTMVKIVQHIQDYNGRCKISTWMIRIAMNLSISHLRKRRLRSHASLEAPTAGSNGDGRTSSLREQLSDLGNLDPGLNVQTREMLGHLEQALDRLDEDFRSVLVLRDINELDYQQIAEVLSVPVGTVKSRLFRARLALRQELAKLYSGLAGGTSERNPASKGASSEPST